MRRAVPVLAATGGALALLANFHSSPPGLTQATVPTSTTTTMVPGVTATVPAASATTAAPETTTTAPAITTTTTGLRTFDGPVVRNEYGNVQVRVTLQGSQLVDVEALQLPSDRARSVSISRTAGPILRQEALEAQSADIDLVSGATYTSTSYAESLQAALDQAIG
jgi:uncharacterized protein with FMN-binding domain